MHIKQNNEPEWLHGWFIMEIIIIIIKSNIITWPANLVNDNIIML